MPCVKGTTPPGFTMAMSRITGEADGYSFWKMVSFVQEDKVLGPVIDAVNWDEIRNPLDFECFLLGASWMTLKYPDAHRPMYSSHDSFSSRVTSLLLVAKTGTNLTVLSRWWPAGATDFKSIIGRAILPLPMLDSTHLGQFIKGAEFMLKLRRVHPSQTLVYAPSLVLACMKEKPPGPLVTQLCDLILPRHRYQKRGRWGIANDRTWIRLLAGQEYPTEDLAWFARLHHWMGLLASPNLSPSVRYYLTRCMKGTDSALVGRLSLPAFKAKLRSLKRNKGDDRWLQVMHGGHYILDDEDDEILAMLPAILNPRWALTGAALLERRSQILKLSQNIPRSFTKLPQILINGGSLKAPKL